MASQASTERSIQSLASVITVAQLKVSRLSKLLQRAETRLAEQHKLWATLLEYGVEYREKISAMDSAGQPLNSALILRRQNLLAMISQVENMKVMQVAQVKMAEAELLRLRQAFQKAHLYVGNLQKLQEKKNAIWQQEKIKHEEKTNDDEYLTRFSSLASIVAR